MKKFSIGVTEFAVPVPRRGSIDVLSGLGRGPVIGQEIHQKIQSERALASSSYKAEVWTSHEFSHGEYTFEVSGRMDGFYTRQPAKIEEIKTSFNVYDLYHRLKDNADHPYCLQIKTYGYFHWLINKKIPELTLHLVSSRSEQSMDLDIQLNIEVYEHWLKLRLDELVDEAKLSEKRMKRRQKTAENFSFPFESPRQGQLELIDTIEEGIVVNRPMLVQAPTGLGKTIGVLYPTLRNALSRGQKVVYITPKNSQHSVAEDAIHRLQETGANIKSMTVTAKSKLCMKNEPLCNPEFCEFAKDHYTKVAEHKLSEVLARKRILKSKTFLKLAEEYQVCPFELQFECMHDVDAVICDYNYVFSPRASFGRLAGGGFAQTGKPNLIIDEVHNLPARAMDYFSPTLSVATLEKMREGIKNIPDAYQANVEKLLDKCISVVRDCSPTDCRSACKITPPVERFVRQDQKLRDFLTSYLKSNIDIQAGDVVLQLSFYWSEFTAALEFVGEGRDEFFTTFHPNPAQVKIVCCDASEMLKACYDDYEQIVGFSATLKPFNYYSQLIGLDSRNLKTAEFESPFPKWRRKLLLIPQITSKFSERERNYPRIAEAIEKIVSVKRGNYFAFFPSFDFMERVFRLFRPPEGFEPLKQERYMRRDAIENVIHQLTNPEKAHVVFAVQGGVFSEGVDYPGDMAIGAFVVGPPLPTFDLEREHMREYYQNHYEDGFNYAYAYPAMAKAIQAAGRVIRSETDQGIIVLMDNRFAQPSFAQSMPKDWFDETPHELVSQSILSDVSKFWQEVESDET